MNIKVDIQIACSEAVPGEQDIRRWVSAALDRGLAETAAGGTPATDRNAVPKSDWLVSLRLVSEEEMRDLNHRYRGREGSTNVLSFPAELPAGIDHPLLGDIAVCPAVVMREAREQGKTAEQHWAHVVVHGSLHLAGHDHAETVAAEAMESLETEILASLDFPCPYGDEENTASQGKQEQ